MNHVEDHPRQLVSREKQFSKLCETPFAEHLAVSHPTMKKSSPRDAEMLPPRRSIDRRAHHQLASQAGSAFRAQAVFVLWVSPRLEKQIISAQGRRPFKAI